MEIEKCSFCRVKSVLMCCGTFNLYLLICGSHPSSFFTHPLSNLLFFRLQVIVFITQVCCIQSAVYLL